MLDFSRLPDVKHTHTKFSEEEEFAFAAHMLARENAYAFIFGASHPDGKIIVPNDIDLRANWPGGGVYRYEPDQNKTGWHYVTHGLSQPYEPQRVVESEECYSGLGIELIMSTPDLNSWAINVLFKLVDYLLFDENSRPIAPYDRLPCNGPLVSGSATKLTHLLAVMSPEYENKIRLPGGFCDIVHLVGVTDKEIAYAKRWGRGPGGSVILGEVLFENGVGTLSDPTRQCLSETIDLEKVWLEKQNELESQWRENGWNGEGKRYKRE
jgi:hypothetical protein